jgi:hypothetical protein
MRIQITKDFIQTLSLRFIPTKLPTSHPRECQNTGFLETKGTIELFDTTWRNGKQNLQAQ